MLDQKNLQPKAFVGGGWGGGGGGRNHHQGRLAGPQHKKKPTEEPRRENTPREPERCLYDQMVRWTMGERGWGVQKNRNTHTPRGEKEYEGTITPALGDVKGDPEVTEKKGV